MPIHYFHYKHKKETKALKKKKPIISLARTKVASFMGHNKI